METIQHQELITRIHHIEEQLQAYIVDDRLITADELEEMSVTELKDWLSFRSTRLQMMIDDGIEQTRSGCATSA